MATTIFESQEVEQWESHQQGAIQYYSSTYHRLHIISVMKGL